MYYKLYYNLKEKYKNIDELKEHINSIGDYEIYDNYFKIFIKNEYECVTLRLFHNDKNIEVLF